MQKNPYILDNFSDNSLHKFWEHYERKFTDKHENGNGVVKENVKYEEINVSNKCDKEKIKKCLVLEAHGDLYKENALTNLEKCVVLLQMLTYVGDDLYDEYINDYPGKCDRTESEQFLKDNANFIDY